MTIQTIKINQRQKRCFEIINELNKNISFVFDAQVNTVSFDKDQLPLIISQLKTIQNAIDPVLVEQIKTILNPPKRPLI